MQRTTKTTDVRNQQLLTGKKMANKPKQILAGDENLSPRRKINGFGMNDIGSAGPAFALPLEWNNTQHWPIRKQGPVAWNDGKIGIRERT